jgi:basic amino acid/polyamine antiporter, APA family
MFRKKKQPKLKRELGIFQATFAGLGIILGAGIYALLGEAAAIAGNSLWISFLIAAFVAAFTGLSYAELSSMYPKDSGEAEYGEKAFGKRVGFLLAWLIIFEGIVSAAAVALGFGGYFGGLIASYVSLPIVMGAILCIVLFSFVNFWGIKESSEFNIISTLIEGGGLILIIVLGLSYFGKVDYMEMAHGFGGTVSAAALIFFAFIGFEAIVKLSEETKNAEKIIPRALIYSIVISTILYVLVALASVSILGWQVLGASKAPLADVAAAVMGSNAFILLAVIALFSTANTVLMILVTTARMMYGIGQKFKKISWMSVIHNKRRTPYLAVAFTMILSIAFALIGDIKLVAEVTNFAIFATFIIINGALLSIRYKYPKKKRPFKIPLNIGWFNIPAFFGILITTGLLFYLSQDWRIYAGGGVLIGLGLLTYSYLEHCNNCTIKKKK